MPAEPGVHTVPLEENFIDYLSDRLDPFSSEELRDLLIVLPTQRLGQYLLATLAQKRKSFFAPKILTLETLIHQNAPKDFKTIKVLSASAEELLLASLLKQGRYKHLQKGHEHEIREFFSQIDQNDLGFSIFLKLKTLIQKDIYRDESHIGSLVERVEELSHLYRMYLSLLHRKHAMSSEQYAFACVQHLIKEWEFQDNLPYRWVFLACFTTVKPYCRGLFKILAQKKNVSLLFTEAPKLLSKQSPLQELLEYLLDASLSPNPENEMPLLQERTEILSCDSIVSEVQEAMTCIRHYIDQGCPESRIGLLVSNEKVYGKILTNFLSKESFSSNLAIAQPFSQTPIGSWLLSLFNYLLSSRHSQNKKARQEECDLLRDFISHPWTWKALAPEMTREELQILNYDLAQKGFLCEHPLLQVLREKLLALQSLLDAQKRESLVIWQAALMKVMEDFGFLEDGSKMIPLDYARGDEAFAQNNEASAQSDEASAQSDEASAKSDEAFARMEQSPSPPSSQTERCSNPTSSQTERCSSPTSSQTEQCSSPTSSQTEQCSSPTSSQAEQSLNPPSSRAERSAVERSHSIKDLKTSEQEAFDEFCVFFEQWTQCWEQNVSGAECLYALRDKIQSLETRSVGFPLEGVQVLDLVEARYVPFEVLIVLGCVEGRFPRALPNDKLVSDKLKVRLGLAGWQYIEALEDTTFHLLCGQAKYFSFLYSTNPDYGSLCRSRFLERILSQNKASLKTVSHKILSSSPLEKTAKHLSRGDFPGDRYALFEEISASSLSQVFRCPYQFLLTKLGVQEKKEDSPSLWEGRWLHEILEAFYTGHVREQKIFEALPETLILEKNQIIPYALKRLQSLTEVCLPLGVQNSPFHLHLLHFSWPRFAEHWSKFFEENTEGLWVFSTKHSLKEYSLVGRGLPLDRKKERWASLLGTLDSLNVHDQSNILVDYKRKNVDSISDLQKGLSPQLPLYALAMAQNRFQEDRKFLDNCLVGYWSIIEGRWQARGIGQGVKAWALDKKLASHQTPALEDLVQKLQVLWDQTVETLIETQGSFYPTPNDSCDYCPFTGVCRKEEISDEA